MAGRKDKQKSNLKPFALRLDERMREKGVSNSQLGAVLGVFPQAISGYRQGKREPSLEALAKIADYLDTSIDYLTARVDEPNPNPDVVKMCEYIGLSSDALERLHDWNGDHYPFKDSKKWLKFLSEMICTDVGGSDPDGTKFFIISTLYDYISFDDEKKFTLSRITKTDDGYKNNPIGVFESNELLIAGEYGFRPITTEIIKSSIRTVLYRNIESWVQYEGGVAKMI